MENTEISKSDRDIVKSLIVMMQTHKDQHDSSAPLNEIYRTTIAEDNLVFQVGMLIRTYQRQQDRIGDLMDGMTKIVDGG